MAKPVAVISQAEYLKKYLTGKKGDKKRRKKKHVKVVTSEKRSIIVDDDEIKTMRPLDDAELDLFALTEDAPQIAGIIDERPDEVRTFENFRSSARWKVLADEDGIEDVKVVAVNNKEKSVESSDDDMSPLRRNRSNSDDSSADRQDSDSDNAQSRTNESKHRGERKSDSRHKPNDNPDDSPTRHKKSHRSRKLKKGTNFDHAASPHSKQRLAVSPPLSKRVGRQLETTNSRKHKSDSDESPIRHSNERNTNRLIKREIDEELSRSYKHDGKRLTKSISNVLDSPPQRRIKNEPLSPPSRQNTESQRASPDISPPRRKKHRWGDQNLENVDSDESPPRRGKYDDDSTQRRGPGPSKRPSGKHQLNKDRDSDESPPRRKNHDDNRYRIKVQDNSKQTSRKYQHEKDADSDESPPRKTKQGNNVSRQRKEAKDTRRRQDSDESPPRQPKRGERESGYDRSRDVQFLKNIPSRQPHGKSVDSDESPPRRRKERQNADESPPRKRKERQNSDESPPRRRKERQNSDESPPRKSRFNDSDKHSRSKIDSNGKIDTSKESLGGNAAPILRDRKTGRIRNLEEEARQKAEESKKTDVTKVKYSRWGKGLAQVAATEVRLNDALHEMSKPVARYADDDDLDKMLRAQDREGDPMLEYMKSKSISVAVANKPRYQGSWMPNRYNIPPGHRWDGVDRSSGYEKQWFENINSRRALEEDAYKWSVADM